MKYLPHYLLRQAILFMPLLYGVSAVGQSINTSGCDMAGFGINSVLYAGETFSAGTPLPPAGSTDWFSKNSSLRNVILQEAGKISSLQTLLNGPGNPLYEVRMNGSLSSKADIVSITQYKLLIDAVWARDHFGGTGGIDTTAFAVSSKNGQDPAVWGTGPTNVLGKNDLIDIGGHMFRNINGTTNDLYFVGLINRAEPGGAAYMDFEFYIKDIKYYKPTATTYKFTSGGPDMGHTAFRFNPDGSIKNLGDILFNVSLTSGGTVPGIEIRVWVSRSDYNTYKASPPANLPFNFGPYFDGAGTNAPFGYASIEPKGSGEACGFVNSAGQLPEAPPWGTKNTKSNIYTNSYLNYSIAEVGMNMTSLGLDYLGSSDIDPCNFPWQTFMVKTRSSASFTAALKDFAGPYAWGQPSVALETSDEFLSCDVPVATLTANPVRDDVTYTWTTSDGNIIGSTTGPSIQADKPGSYYVEMTLPTGCKSQGGPITLSYDPNKPSFYGPPVTQTTIPCNGNNGTLQATVSGGTAPYTFNLFRTVSGTESQVTTATNVNTTTHTFTGLEPGDYRVEVKGIYACITTTEKVVVPAKTPVEFTADITHVLCFGEKTGKIELGTVNGDGPLTYLWNTGKTTKDLLNVVAGEYTVTITDVNGCTESFDFTVNGPSEPLSGTISKTDDPGTAGNGSASVSVLGGTSPYNYSWTKTGDSNFSANTNEITGIGYGEYTVRVTDDNGCIKDFKIFVYEAERCFDGIDNNGNGLSDCDDPACIPATPAPTGPVNPCKNDPVFYTIGAENSGSFEWILPANVTLASGQGTHTITATWTSTVPGQICVRAVNPDSDPQSSLKCYGSWKCLSVSPEDTPNRPAAIYIQDNN
jgi:hypothetical protein